VAATCAQTAAVSTQLLPPAAGRQLPEIVRSEPRLHFRPTERRVALRIFLKPRLQPAEQFLALSGWQLLLGFGGFYVDNFGRSSALNFD
jgi:hypothetical protein